MRLTRLKFIIVKKNLDKPVTRLIRGRQFVEVFKHPGGKKRVGLASRPESIRDCSV